MPSPSLILASTSPYRRELLQRLGLPFLCEKPQFDEEAAKDKAPPEPQEHSLFLARGKAQSLRSQIEAGATVIGGDQLVSFEGQILGKPGTVKNAQEQLTRMSGKTHHLLTAQCVIQGGQKIEWVHSTTLRMRRLSPEQIQTYVSLDQPLDCAGAYKIEKHGIALFDEVLCDDWTAIQGLPLMELSRVLARLGFEPFRQSGGHT